MVCNKNGPHPGGPTLIARTVSGGEVGGALLLPPQLGSVNGFSSVS
jgi:hypothetical protein